MPSITVYSRPNCQPCKATKRQLDKLGADYTVIDVTEDEAALEFIRGLGYLQAPVVVAGDHHWAGFSPDKLAWAAGEK
ncbi:glutaredoxin family protein [Nocardia cyriacigeorgica]|uniref:glutaredoxin family protein n=1 Tax=Nocardia cyriacigeorgica TaxID=135487 RepID=UPI00189625F8|nr:glutaredoxin family protein [Nocardia cyriacigeorgica]MBF6326570.1 glutaredoxin family protein [Nocardia cyriacigeorgica]